MAPVRDREGVWATDGFKGENTMMNRQRHGHVWLLFGACCALAWSAAAAQALVTIDFLEKNSNAAVVYVPLGGGTYDITVRLTSDEQVQGVSSAATCIAASSPGFINVAGAVNGQGPTGTGTRYNAYDWYWHPDTAAYPVSAVAGPLGTTIKGPYGSSTDAESPYFTSSVLGWINLSLMPRAYGESVVLSPVDVFIANARGDQIANTRANSIVFAYVPEPSVCLLMGGCVAFVTGSSRNRGVGRRLRRSALGASGWSESQ